MKFDLNVVQRSDNAVSINVGGSGFKALAVWLIDSVETMDAFKLHDRMQTEWIRVVLNCHFDYFSQHRILVSPTTTPLSYMKQLIATVPTLELISSLTWTLGCIAIEELFSKPVLYRDVFSRRKSVSLINLMTQILIQPNQYCIAALAAALQLDIEIQYVGDQQAVYSRFQYFYAVCVDMQKVILQLQDEEFFLLVTTPRKWPDNLYQTTADVSNAMLDKLVTKTNGLNIDEMVFNANKALLLSFEHHYLRLTARVVAGDLTLVNLIAIYTECERGPRVDKRVGTEQGNQRYFNQIIQKHGDVIGVTFPTTGYLDDMTKTILHALARAMSLGEINPSIIENYSNIPCSRIHSSRANLDI